MPGRKLPPLLAGGCYMCPPMSNIEVTPPDLEREVRGETTAMFRVRLSNEVMLEIPVRAFQLQMLMSSLMRTFPQQAMANLRLCIEQEQEDDDAGPGRNHGTHKN